MIQAESSLRATKAVCSVALYQCRFPLADTLAQANAVRVFCSTFHSRLPGEGQIKVKEMKTGTSSVRRNTYRPPACLSPETHLSVTCRLSIPHPGPEYPIQLSANCKHQKQSKITAVSHLVRFVSHLVSWTIDVSVLITGQTGFPVQSGHRGVKHLLSQTKGGGQVQQKHLRLLVLSSNQRTQKLVLVLHWLRLLPPPVSVVHVREGALQQQVHVRGGGDGLCWVLLVLQTLEDQGVRGGVELKQEDRGETPEQEHLDQPIGGRVVGVARGEDRWTSTTEEERQYWYSQLEACPSGLLDRRMMSLSPFRMKISLSQHDTDTMSPLLSNAPTIT
ncbi:hypothetical protein F7725_008815 [Dissostichus mawsoni]|uniref:Uncharacterized protein n=1 Tax=Dissostichus mawsoni TaxID=36200 RepID=A0A7J5Y873_DISMA|nr:hypothetical protein F7725_008815 [Dissostichus mawsoni]